MVEHFSAQVIEDLGIHARERVVLNVVEHDVRHGVHQEDQGDDVQAAPPGSGAILLNDEAVDAPRDDQRLHHDRDDVPGHPNEGERGPEAVPQDVPHEAYDDPVVVELAEDLIIEGGTTDVAVTDGRRGRHEAVVSCSASDSIGRSCES